VFELRADHAAGVVSGPTRGADQPLPDARQLWKVLRDYKDGLTVTQRHKFTL
jgi:hypothetical protein